MLLCASSIFMLNACEARLDSPGKISLDETTLTISWEKVPGAYGYSVTISGDEKSTKATSYSLVDLAPGKYKIEVKALGDGETISDSDTVKYDFERKYETGLIYRLINNNSEYQLVGAGSASGDIVMESYYRGKPVTSIAPSAFAINNDKIVSFTLNEFVKTIPEKAFYNCPELTKIVIPDNVTKIENNAFQSCKVLKEVIIPDSVTVISDRAFSYCRLLEKATIGNATTKIGNYAFSDCTSLEEIYIPDTVKEIGDYAFSNCKVASSLYIGKGVESIGEYAFYSLEAIEEITLPTALKALGKSAFEECPLVKNIVIPDNVTQIGERAFAACSALESVQIGSKIEKIGSDAFLDTAYVENYTNDIVYVGDWIITCKNKGISPREDISNYFLGGSPVGIADYAFYKCTLFTTANLSTVKYIGNYAFSQCESLSSVNLGAPCTTIGEGSFADCTTLSTVKMSSSSISFIDAFAFVNCKNLTKIDLPDTVEMIGTRAFYQSGLPVAVDGVIYADNWVVGVRDTSVSKVNVREGTVGIAMYSFFNCTMIGEVKLPNSLKVIGKGAFAVCASIKIEEMPSSLERIEDYAFYGCTASQFGGDDYHIALPESLTYIGRSAFYSTLVMGLEIPSSCKYIGDYAFWGAIYLGAEVNFNTIVPGEDGTNEIVKTTTRFYLTLNDGIEYIGSRAFFKTGIIDLAIPDSVKEIGIRAFYGCDDLKTVTIGHGLAQIPDYAFYECVSLEEVYMANGSVDIGAHAFQNCKALTKVELSKTLKTIGKAAFLGCEALVDLELPASLTTIGEHALRGMRADGSIVIHSGISSIGQHAFYGNPNLTVYAEGDKASFEYRTFWNSLWRPVIYGCELSADKSYVVSIVINEETVTNAAAVGGISAPERVGYEFEGWATSEDGNAVYSASDIPTLANGTTLYAKWRSMTEK